MKLTWSHGVVGVAAMVLVAACETSSDTDDGDATSGQGAGGSVSSVATASAQGGSGTSTGTSTGTGGNTGVPCQPLGDRVDPMPTPGSCAGNVASTCGEDGFIHQEACGSDTCQTYPLEEWIYDGMAGENVRARDVTWAGCLPTGAAACELTFDGNVIAATLPRYCDAAGKNRCGLPPVPSPEGSPALLYTTTVGVLYTESCPNGERCAGSDTLNLLTCIDENTPACDGTEPRCDGDGLGSGNGTVSCQGTWESLPGYQVVETCDGGDVCYQGSLGPSCRQPGEQPCDEATFPRVCTASGTETIDCWAGFTQHQSCATCRDHNSNLVACRCDEKFFRFACGSDSTVRCVPAAAPDCDPATEADTCVGNVARRCLGHWEETDCGAAGMECGTANGIAGCREPGAPACTSGIVTCDATEQVGCCGCSGVTQFMGQAPALLPCVPGFEIRAECTDLGSTYICQENPAWFNADCVVP